MNNFRVFFLIAVFFMCFFQLVHSNELHLNQLIDSCKSYWRTDLNKAEEFADLALEVCDKADFDNYGKCLKNKGVVFYFKSELDSALSYYKRALVCFEKEGSIIGKCKILNNMGVLEMELGNYKEAIEYYNIAYKAALSINDTAMLILCLNNTSNVHHDNGNFTESAQILKSVITMYDNRSDNIDLAHTYSNISTDYRKLNKVELSINYSKKALEIYKELKDSLGIATEFVNQAKLNIDLGRYNKAILMHEKALNIYTTQQNTRGVVYVKESMVACYNLMGQYEKSKQIALVGIELAKKHNLKRSLAFFYHQMYINSLLLKKPIEAMEYNRLSDQMKDSIFNDKVTEHLTEIETKYKTLEKQQQIQKLSAEKAQQELILKNERQKRSLISIITLLVGVLGIGAFVLYRYKQKQKRTQLAQTKSKIENRLLRVQMNPHFMFNSLNSVQSYIASNQNELAEDYLARFAQLTRAILNNSREDFITLDNEIETLKTYLELEQQRFNHAFKFAINIDDEVDEDLLKVPPMLIQPYVENAIIHGVAPLKAGGEIKLVFRLTENEKSVLCTITDNGIGREASMKINKGSKHKSLGLQVTKERFELIKQQTGVDVKAEIVDLPNGKGTRVEMVIPYLKS